MWYHIRHTTTCGIFRAVEPLAEVDPADRKSARADTPAPEAAAWLADPDKPREEVLTPNMRYIQWLANQPAMDRALARRGFHPGGRRVSGIPSDQVLAILRLRQWAVERTALKCGRTTRLTNAGWRERRETDADARNVRVIDFEKALATLDTAHQYALVLIYRDRVGHAATAAAIGCSIRTLAYMLPAARRRLADALDRRDLL